MTGKRHRHYILAFLTTLYAVNFVDLAAMGMALQSIKLDLHLSDTKLGLVSGVAFSLFYSTFGVPMGWLADRSNRVVILSATRIFWGIFVVLTGRISSFLELFICRAGVAIGEAGCVPPGYSLIGDYYSRLERPQALGIFFLGSPLSALVGFFLTGWLIQLYGWRMMFTVVGIPGFILSLLTWMIVKEPRHNYKNGGDTGEEAGGSNRSHLQTPMGGRVSVFETLRSLSCNATYRNLVLALVVAYFFEGGLYQWQAPFFVRSYRMESSSLGMWLAMAQGIPGIIGSVLGGVIASRWAGRNERLQLVVLAALFCSTGILSPITYLTRDYRAAFALIGVSQLTLSLGIGPIFAAIQAVTPGRSRAMSVMFVFLFANLIGTGLGPLLVGALSDHLRAIFGAESLRYALLSMSPWFLGSGWYALRASRSIVRDIETAAEDAGSEVYLETGRAG